MCVPRSVKVMPDPAIRSLTVLDTRTSPAWAAPQNTVARVYREVIAVGKQGIELARTIEELGAASREKSAEIREKRAAVQAVALGLTPEAFLALLADLAIEEKLAVQERELTV